MNHIMVCFSGYSGVGKDECAKRLRESYNAVHTGLADPAKRHLADVYGFSAEQMFGPSSMRNTGDLRYPKPGFFSSNLKEAGLGSELSKFLPVDANLFQNVQKDKFYYWCESRSLDGVEDIPAYKAAPRINFRLGSSIYLIERGHSRFWLSPREGLQKYCNGMMDLFSDTWVKKGIEVQQQLAIVESEENGIRRMKYSYDRMLGLLPGVPSASQKKDDIFVSCFSDFRHPNEIRYARALNSPQSGLKIVVVRVKHPKITTPPYNHRSEVEQSTLADSSFDHVIMNEGTIDDLYAKIDRVMLKEAF